VEKAAGAIRRLHTRVELDSRAKKGGHREFEHYLKSVVDATKIIKTM